MVDVILGLQWGDEGKGKIVDYLADKYDIIARFQGGPNAGHTLHINGVKHVLHTVPSGIFREGKINYIGNGVVIDPIILLKEIEHLEQQNVPVKERLIISKRANLILPTHKILDAASEAAKGTAKIGSTLKGIGPTYMDKTGRNGLRIGDIVQSDFLEKYNILKEKHLQLLQIYQHEFDLAPIEKEWFDAIEKLKNYEQVESVYFINKALQDGKKILAEGAQGSMLDIDFGTYPFVTSSNTISAAVCTGLGISPKNIGEVIGITKAYCTRVGGGPFPSELEDETGEKLRKEGAEFGATTGRPRRCGWIDLPALNYACLINGVTQLIITKADILNAFDEFGICTHYEFDGQQTNELPYDMVNKKIAPVFSYFKSWRKINKGQQLPEELTQYIAYLEDYLKTKVSMVSNGPGRDELIELEDSPLLA